MQVLFFCYTFFSSFTDNYDVLTVSAGFGEGHVPCSALYEMIRVVKPGSLFVHYNVPLKEYNKTCLKRPLKIDKTKD